MQNGPQLYGMLARLQCQNIDRYIWAKDMLLVFAAGMDGVYLSFS